MSFQQKVQFLIDHCDRNNSFDELLNQVKLTNPHKFAEFNLLLGKASGHKAETSVKALQQLIFSCRKTSRQMAVLQTRPRSRGNQQIKDEPSLPTAIVKILKHYHVQALFDCQYECQVKERSIRAYKGQPARLKRQVRYQLSVTRNPVPIAVAQFQAGWRVYATNAPSEELSLTEAVPAYRDQYIQENFFRRLQGKFLSITPVYVQRDDHAQGLFHFLTLGAHLLALAAYLSRQALSQEDPRLY